MERINVKFSQDSLNLTVRLFPSQRSLHRGPLLLWRGQRAAGGARGGWRPAQWWSLAPGEGRAQREGGVAPARPASARHQGGSGPRPHPPAAQQPAVYWCVCACVCVHTLGKYSASSYVGLAILPLEHSMMHHLIRTSRDTATCSLPWRHNGNINMIFIFWLLEISLNDWSPQL